MWREFLVLAALGALGATQAPDAGTLVADAAHELAGQRHGAVAFTLAYRYTEHGPAHNVERLSRAMVLRDGGAVVKVRTFGRPSNPPTYVEADYELPIEPAYLTEYRFTAGTASCALCPAGAIAIDFVSLRRDDEHGDGTMWVDGSSHRVLALHYHPSVLPAHTDSADVTVAFGQVLPDLWDVTVTEQQYNGHEFVFHGWGHVEQRQTAYRRFASVADGLTALSAAAPDAPSAATP